MQTIESSLHGVENKIFGDLIQRHNVGNVQQFETFFVGQADKINEKSPELETKEPKITTSLNLQMSQVGNNSFTKIEKRIEQRKERLEELENKINDISVKTTEREGRAE